MKLSFGRLDQNLAGRYLDKNYIYLFEPCGERIRTFVGTKPQSESVPFEPLRHTVQKHNQN